MNNPDVPENDMPAPPVTDEQVEAPAPVVEELVEHRRLNYVPPPGL